ncbi:MAG: type II secretion system GspH family protein [Patescibacteria group bacterium]|nr:type II secretion system GspH family protein [Patescibacteria group bacterium]
MKKFFTLIEILVVVTVIALLASVVTVSYVQLNKEGRNNKRKADVEQIRTALEMYKSNNDQYPDSLSSLVSPVVYMSSIPSDPKSSYFYRYSKISNFDYVIGVYLEGISSSCSISLNCGSAQCNYCLGPYGTK